MNTFENNIKALQAVDENLAKELQEIKTNKLYEVFVTDMQNFSDLSIVDNRDATTIDDSIDINDKLKKYEEFDNYHSLYFFGVGSGVFYEKLLQNPIHKVIYIFEPELELLYIVLNLIDFSADILNKRLVLKESSNIDIYQAKNTISIESMLYLKTYKLNIYSAYYDKYVEEAQRVNTIILLVFRHELQDKGNSLDDTLVGLRHSAKNMLWMFKHPSLLKVLNTIKGRSDAVMVATGPSLQKQIPILKKYQDYFTILCVDASFPILSKEGIKPDIVLSMERVSATSNFYKNTPKKFHKDVVFTISTVCHQDTFDAIDADGGMLCPFLRADAHNMIEELNDWGYLGGGLSSANYLFSLAINSYFKNIVLIGQDLAYAKDGSSHSIGHVFGEDQVKPTKIANIIQAYGGEGEVYTSDIWKVFLNDLVVQIESSKKTREMKIYNATEGGARINGAEEIPFEIYCKDILDKSQKKEQIVLEYPSVDEINEITTRYLKKQTEIITLAKSLYNQANKTFLLVENFLNTIKDFDNEQLVNKTKNRKLNILLEKIYKVQDKYAEPKFRNIFETLFLSYLSHIDFDVAVVKTMREDTPKAIKLKKINYIKVHYEWLYRLAGSLKLIIEIFEDSLKKA